GFPRRQRKVEVEVLSRYPIEAILVHSHFKVEISSRCLPKAGSALTLETDVLPVEDSFRDGDIEGPIAKRDMAGLVGFGHAQSNGSRGPLQAITQVDQDLGVMILSAHVKLSAAAPRLAAAHGSKQCVEEIAVLLAATCGIRS